MKVTYCKNCGCEIFEDEMQCPDCGTWIIRGKKIENQEDSQLTIEEIEILELASNYLRADVWLKDKDEEILMSALRKLEKQKEMLKK